MRSPRVSSLVPCSLLAVVIAGCGDDPPSPSDVRTRVADDLGNVLQESQAAIDGGSDALPGSSALAILDRFTPASREDGTLVPRLRSKLSGLVAPREDLRSTGGLATGDEEPAPALVDADAIISYLNDQLFTDANHRGDGIYVVPPELVCMDETVADDGSITEILDAECARQVEEAELRVRVAADGDALDFAIQVDADHDEPLRFRLTHTSLAITFDLDETGRAIAALAPIVGEEAPNASLAGQLTAAIDILGTAHARFGISIDRPLAVAVAEPGIALDAPEALRFTSAKANVVSIVLDGAGRTGSAVLGVGATTAHLPGEGEDGTYDLDLPGISAVAMYTAGQPLQLTNLGLGERTTSLFVDGQRAIAIDLNPDSGRALGATIASDPATGLDTITVAPELDLRFAIDHAVLGEEAPLYDVTRVRLDGTVRGGDGSARIEVVAGDFSIETSPAGYGFSATAGQCVTSTTAEDVTTGAFYELWAVGASE